MAEQEEQEEEVLEETEETTEEVVETEPTRESELEDQLRTERENVIRLEERVALSQQKTEPAVKEEPPPKVFTRQELRAAVNEGKLDDDQMEQIWSDQNHARTLRDTEALMNRRDGERTIASTVDVEYDKYVAAFPSLDDKASADWGKVKTEYDYLVNRLGHPATKTTELAALRSALGRNDRIQEHTAELRETARGTGGGEAGGKRPGDIWNRVPKHMRVGLKKLVSDGYRTLADVEKDIPYMREKGELH